MDNEHRRWMYDRVLPNRRGLRDEFKQGVEGFINQANLFCQKDGTIRCPCADCNCIKWLKPEDVRADLCSKGFMDDYYVWTSHGEIEGSASNICNHNFVAGESSEDPRLHEMVMDALGMYNEGNNQQPVDQPPNEEAQRFYAQLESASRPFCECMSHSALSVAVRLLSIKSDANISIAGMNAMIELMKELNPNLDIPDDYYKAKKLVSKLGLSSMKIDCCEKGCMLYYRDNADLENCKVCGISRFKQLASDGEAWKHFDRTFSDFANEPRNIRLGLCADGFTPFSVSVAPYSCWPVFVTPYNLPPEMCMTSPYLFLTCIVPGPRNPKSLIDVYLQPLIYELQTLWHEGVLTYDISTKQNFNMRVALMWTINDFPAYGMLSGWMTAGKLACPCCMENTKSFTLKHEGKNSWFDCHRQFLPMDHEFRSMRNAFRKNKTEHDLPPPTLSGEQIWERVRDLPKVTETPPSRLNGYGVEHNWTKQSIFWELPYWKHNLLRHNLDVMHIEKNYFDNLFNTVMDVRDKTKDNIKARKDLMEYCRRPELHLQQSKNKNKIAKPKASYTFTLEDK
ncbi:uncharacterized protein LOC132612291 [Lycium barbarum]|uniref:uncharacterized protein LOC132612291 n=1 Tax=Lycium barbarum TaxID=112863 RepID=UPI00293E0736|nr:uncharacterized protein LOC132612291 [Lycium barbarum]